MYYSIEVTGGAWKIVRGGLILRRTLSRVHIVLKTNTLL